MMIANDVVLHRLNSYKLIFNKVLIALMFAKEFTIMLKAQLSDYPIVELL
jgi:hypothetical protein